MVSGYKQTDIGLIPVGWNVKIITDLSNPVRGGSPRPAGDPKYFNGTYIPWLTVASLTNLPKSKLFVNKIDSYLTKEGSLRSRILEKDTLIIANSGATLGIVKILSIKCCANDGVAALLNLNKSINKLFLAYYMNTRTDYLRDVVATGNGQPNLNTTLIGNLQIPLPPLPEQEAIAEVLSDTDALIGALEKRIAKKRLIKQGAMQTLLTPKDDWEVKKLGEVANCFAGGTPSTFNPSYWGGDIIWLQSGKVQNKLIKNEEQLTKITKKGLNESSARLIKPNSVLVAITGATCGNIGLLTFEATANQSVVAIEPNKNFDYQFIYYSLLLNKNLILSYQTGSAQGGVNLKSVKNISLKFPIEFEQTRIATILSDMDNEINALEKKLSKTKELKQGLMQQLLTGKIRLV